MAQQKTQAQKAPASKQPAKRTAAKAPAGKAVPAQTERRTFSRNEKVFYVISLLVVVSMVVGLVAVALTPPGF